MKYSIIAKFIFLFCALAWGMQGDSFQYDDSGRLYQAVQSNGLIHNYATDAEGSILTASFSSTDTTAGGGLGNGIPDWWENYYFGISGIDPHGNSGDGIPNLMKFALGLSPTQTAIFGELPIGSVDGSNMRLTFRKGKAATNLDFLVQSSTDLISWADRTAETDAALAHAPLLSDENSDTYIVSVPMVGNKFFMRLKVLVP